MSDTKKDNGENEKNKKLETRKDWYEPFYTPQHVSIAVERDTIKLTVPNVLTFSHGFSSQGEQDLLVSTSPSVPTVIQCDHQVTLSWSKDPDD